MREGLIGLPSQKRKELKILEKCAVRCYKCSHIFEKEMSLNDNMSDLDCVKCGKKTVEACIGTKHKVISE